MWTIRTEQVESLRQSSLKDFEDCMVAHLQGFNSGLARVLGDEGLRTVIRYGLKRAEPYKFTRRACVQFFIEMIIIFGAEFDTDPQYPWVARVLTDPSIDDQTVRADRLHEAVMEYWAVAIGQGASLATAALQRVRHEPFDGPSVHASDFAGRVDERLRRIYPEKHATIGPLAFAGLVRRGREEAAANAVTSDAGVALLLGLMFTLGHGITRDPHMPWVGNTLGNAAIADPNTRAERLYAKSMTYLDAVLKEPR